MGSEREHTRSKTGRIRISGRSNISVKLEALGKFCFSTKTAAYHHNKFTAERVALSWKLPLRRAVVAERLPWPTIK